MLVQKAEGAIKFFKDIAFERQGKAVISAYKAEKENNTDQAVSTRVQQNDLNFKMKFQTGKSIGPQLRSYKQHMQMNTIETNNTQPDQSTNSLIHNYLGRSKSANSPSYMNSQDKQTNEIRYSQVSPNRVYEINSKLSDNTFNIQKSEPRISFVNANSKDNEQQQYQSRYLQNKNLANERPQKSYSSSKMATINEANNQYFENNRSPQSSQKKRNRNSNSMSLNTKKRIAYVERIQKLNNEGSQANQRQEQNLKLLLAIEAMEDSFNEISEIKQNIQKYCGHHLQINCKLMQEFNVLSFDYLKLIDERIQTENELRSQIKKKNAQMQNLKEIVYGNQSLIKQLQSHLVEQQSLKQSQWKNIISYDCVKDKEQAKTK